MPAAPSRHLAGAPITKAVNVSNVQIHTGLQGLESVQDKRVQLQAALLRKALDSQEQQAAELLKLIEGKGQVVDIRV